MFFMIRAHLSKHVFNGNGHLTILQRSSSMPDSQLSPSYATTSASREAGRVLGPSPSQISPSNRVGVGPAPPFSPTHSFSTQGFVLYCLFLTEVNIVRISVQEINYCIYFPGGT